MDISCGIGSNPSTSTTVLYAKPVIRVLLADDDIDDCVLFEDALAELDWTISLSVVNDGEQLFKKLFEGDFLPDVLFLDLNMPRRNGVECLADIKQNSITRNLPVIIISTSFNPEFVELLQQGGALFYIRKPEQFESLKNVVDKALAYVNNKTKISLNSFVLNP